MVDRKVYKRLPRRAWEQMTVRTTRVLSNGNIEVPVGTICRIFDKRGGFNLKTEACKTCGVSVYITHVRPEDVEVVV